MPGWVGPTVAISLVVIAGSFVTIAVAIALTLRAASAMLAEGQRLLADGRRLVGEGERAAALVREETERLAGLSRQVQRSVRRGMRRATLKAADLEALYDVVAGEVEATALDVASTLRSTRTRGIVARMRRLLVPRR